MIFYKYLLVASLLFGCATFGLSAQNWFPKENGHFIKINITNREAPEVGIDIVRGHVVWRSSAGIWMINIKRDTNRRASSKEVDAINAYIARNNGIIQDPNIRQESRIDLDNRYNQLMQDFIQLKEAEQLEEQQVFDNVNVFYSKIESLGKDDLEEKNRKMGQLLQSQVLTFQYIFNKVHNYMLNNMIIKMLESFSDLIPELTSSDFNLEHFCSYSTYLTSMTSNRLRQIFHTELLGELRTKVILQLILLGKFNGVLEMIIQDVQ